MKQLIDTHTLLWFTMGNPRISFRCLSHTAFVVKNNAQF
ncbi:hypothetical protein BMF77_04337 [Dolichospermum sp. UHCC 0315A]|jgi:PIN domain nuclease of toxin-antitoxin system|nr:hypothetical protein BMF77_04337 [Dolichospermum sp. UHCC 0315A]